MRPPYPQIESTVKMARENLLSQIELYQKQGVKGSSEVNEQGESAKKTELKPETIVGVNTVKEKPVADSRPKHEL